MHRKACLSDLKVKPARKVFCENGTAYFVTAGVVRCSWYEEIYIYFLCLFSNFLFFRENWRSDFNFLSTVVRYLMLASLAGMLTK